MKRLITSLMTLSLLGGVPMIAGCDKEVEHTETQKKNADGTVDKKEKTVEKTPEGGTKTTETEQHHQ